MICAVISPKVRIGCDRVRHEFVARRWLLVARKEKKHTMLVGFEAESSASSGRKVSAANVSEAGRLGRRSESDGVESVKSYT